MARRDPWTSSDFLARLGWLADPVLSGLPAGDFEPAGLAKWLHRQDPDPRRCQEAAVRFLASPPRLGEVLQGLAERLLTPWQGHVELRREGRFRQAARLIDPDSLTCLDTRWRALESENFGWAALAEHHDGAAAAALHHGSIDTHIHLGAALPPLYYWLALMGGELPAMSLRKVADGDGDSFRRWDTAVDQAILLRLQMAIRANDLSQQRDARAPFPWLRQHWRDLEPTGSQLESGSNIRNWALHFRPSELDEDAPPAPTTFYDPLRLVIHPHYAAGERRLLYWVRRLLYDCPEPPDVDLEQKLLRYLRYRNSFHSTLSYDHQADGLAPFVTTFNRRSLLKGAARSGPRRGRRRRRSRRLLLRLERDRMAKGLEAQLADPFDPSPAAGADAPRGIEMRVEPPTGCNSLRFMRAWLEGIADFVAGGKRGAVQVGLLFHFIKAKRVHGRPEFEHEIAERALREAEAIAYLLSDFPHLRRMVIGIDAAGEERLATPRAFEQAFFHLRHFERTQRVAPWESPVRLGRTFHVGEDVDDFLTGLRHLDETVALLLRSRGGRLGHALILGECPKRFYERRQGRTEPRLLTHVLDLLWAWRVQMESGGDRVNWLADRLRSLSGCSHETLSSLGESLLEARRNGEARTRLESELVAGLLAPGKAGKAAEAEYYQVDANVAWIELMSWLQQKLRDKFRVRNLCIEANPTSNLLIGGYTSYQELPYRTLVNDGLAVSINTDDPGIFMTSLPGEMSALYYESLLPKLGHRQALEWLADRVRDAEFSTFLHERVPKSPEWSRSLVDDLVRWRHALR